MSSCSVSAAPPVRFREAGFCQRQRPPALEPTSRYPAKLATASLLGDAAQPGEGEAPNGQHHLLRHVLSNEQCGEALRHFGTADSKAAARMVNRMSQRELRDMFARVYSVHTNSNNNTWLRRKLLEAVGASRRFYNAANRTGRPKGARRAASGAPHAGATPHAAPAPTKASRKAAAAPPQQPTAAQPTAQPHAPAPHHFVGGGPSLPAGSPRALSQRLRGAPPPAHHRSPFSLGPPPAHSSEEDTCSERSGYEAAQPSALGPRAMALDAHSPTAAAAPALFTAGSSAIYSMGSSNSSLITSQYAAALHPLPHPYGVPQLLAPPPAWDRAPPRVPSLGTFAAPLPGYPLQQQEAAAPLGGLPGSTSVDLGLGLLSAIDASVTAMGGRQEAAEGEEWLTWEDWKLPALF